MLIADIATIEYQWAIPFNIKIFSNLYKPLVIVQNSTSALDRGITFCFLLRHVTKLLPKRYSI